jgi:hypothetical protein
MDNHIPDILICEGTTLAKASYKTNQSEIINLSKIKQYKYFKTYKDEISYSKRIYFPLFSFFLILFTDRVKSKKDYPIL